MDAAKVVQNTPKPGTQVVYPHLLSDIVERVELGQSRYGTPLMSFNGRNAFMDAYQEVLDLAMYMKQILLETALKTLEHQAPCGCTYLVTISLQNGELELVNLFHTSRCKAHTVETFVCPNCENDITNEINEAEKEGFIKICCPHCPATLDMDVVWKAKEINIKEVGQTDYGPDTLEERYG